MPATPWLGGTGARAPVRLLGSPAGPAVVRVELASGEAPWLSGGLGPIRRTWRFFTFPGGAGAIPAQSEAASLSGPLVVSAVGRTGLESPRVAPGRATLNERSRHGSTSGTERILALGIDAGGTRTRWALASAAGEIVAEGHVAGFSALKLHDAAGPCRRPSWRIWHAPSSAATSRARACRPHGFGDASEDLAQLIAAPLGLPVRPSRWAATSRPPTSISSRRAKATGLRRHRIGRRLHRRGRSATPRRWPRRPDRRRRRRLLDRARSAAPCLARRGRAARKLAGFADGSGTLRAASAGRTGRTRGSTCTAAIAATSAGWPSRWPVPLIAIRRRAASCARRALNSRASARAMIGRYGPRPVALCGRAATLHPLIAEAMRAALPAGTPLHAAPLPRPPRGRTPRARARPRRPHTRTRKRTMKRILACLLRPSAVAGCAHGPRIDHSYRAKSQDSRVAVPHPALHQRATGPPRSRS